MSSVCQTFRSLAFNTWDHLAKARLVGYQPHEETITDINVLELKCRHPNEVKTKTFTKPQEGIHGADWEWWLTDKHQKHWLGLRVQAKILNLRSGRFEHLHYRKGQTYQITKFKRAAAQDGLVPIYCVYVQWEPDPTQLPLQQFWSTRPIESHGCSLISVNQIDKLRKQSEENRLHAVVRGAIPWHCLVCDQDCYANNLPHGAWKKLQDRFGIKSTRRKPKDAPSLGIRDKPPSYVEDIATAGEDANVPENADGTRGIVIIQGQE